MGVAITAQTASMLVQHTAVFCGNTPRLVFAINRVRILKHEQLKAKAQAAELLGSAGGWRVKFLRIFSHLVMLTGA